VTTPNPSLARRGVTTPNPSLARRGVTTPNPSLARKGVTTPLSPLLTKEGLGVVELKGDYLDGRFICAAKI